MIKAAQYLGENKCPVTHTQNRPPAAGGDRVPVCPVLGQGQGGAGLPQG